MCQIAHGHLYLLVLWSWQINVQPSTGPRAPRRRALGRKPIPLEAAGLTRVDHPVVQKGQIPLSRATHPL